MDTKKMINLIKKILKKVFFKEKKREELLWSGDFESLQEAQVHCGSYSDEGILEKVTTATRKVVSGEAVYERDSVLFDTIQYSYPVLAGLLLAAARGKGRISVLDFGGSLGSSYYQNRKFLQCLDLQWSIVEQKKFVDVGKEEFTTPILEFYYRLEDCVAERQPNVVLLSSVLQYLDDPYVFLNQIKGLQIDMVLISRTPVVSPPRETDRITVQKVPGHIYEASYPCRFLSRKAIQDCLMPEFDLLEEFDDKIDPRLSFGSFVGMVFVRSNPK